MLDQKSLLRNILNEFFDKFCLSESAETDFYGTYPNTLFSPRDYLDYAEDELKQIDNGVDHLINCIGHLKRAIDAQIDIFFNVLGVNTIFQKRNLKFDKKLEFLKQMDLVSPSTLSRFNRIRNQIEHEHNLPLDLDMEVFFDLSTAFIISLELTIVLLTTSELTFDIRRYGKRLVLVGDVYEQENEGKDEFEIIEGAFFKISHKFPTPEIVVSWNLNSQEQNLRAKITNVSTESDVAEFAYFLRVFVLLVKYEGFATSNLYVYDHI